MTNLSPNHYPLYSLKQYGDKALNSTSTEQEGIISQLKTQVFDLQQNEKNYNALLYKYKSLLSDSNKIEEDKIRLEYELKQKTESTTKILSELQTENEALNSQLKDKQATNLSLFNDNNALFSTLESRSAEVETMRGSIAEREAMIEKLTEERSTLQRDISHLTEVNGANETALRRLDTEIVQLSKICEDQEAQINELAQDRKRLNSQLDSLSLDNKATMNNLKGVMDQLQMSQNQLENCEKAHKKQREQLTESEQNANRAKSELETVNSALIKEKGISGELVRKSERLDNSLRDKANEIKKMTTEIENMRSSLDKTTQERNRALSDIEKYATYIKFLTQTNQKLIKELEDVLNINEKIKQQLNRTDKITSILHDNKSELDSALNYLEKKITRTPKSSLLS